MSCGTCPTSAQPTTRQDGTAPTPGTLLWSADVGAWYRRQRAQSAAGDRPVITMPATTPPPSPGAQSAALHPEDPSIDRLTAAEHLARTLLGDNRVQALLAQKRDEAVLISRGAQVLVLWRKGCRIQGFTIEATTGIVPMKDIVYTRIASATANMAVWKQWRQHCLECGAVLLDGICHDCMLRRMSMRRRP